MVAFLKKPIFLYLCYDISTYFYVLDLKRKTFAEFFLSKVSNFYFKQKKQLFY